MNQNLINKEWNTLAEFTLHNEPDWDKKMAENLTVAVSQYHLPVAFLSRLKAGVKKAVGKIFQDGNEPAVQRMLRIRLVFKGAQAHLESYRGWGFFLISKHIEEAGRSDIGVFLYQEEL